MELYQNPLLLTDQWTDDELGDPFIMRFNGEYYLYCSSAGPYIKCWKSWNLTDWEYQGSVCDDERITGAYAPEVHYGYGKFYMITSPVGSGHYILEANHPLGPFQIITKNLGQLIDGSLFFDDDGSEYLLRAGHQGIVIHDMPSVSEVEEAGLVIEPSYLNYWTEGPMILKKDDFYFLTYTGNHLLSRGYRIAYSVSSQGPDRGYENLDNHIMMLETGDEFHAIGHSSSVPGPDLESHCIAYHTFALDRVPKSRRLNVDRLYFNGARMYANPVWWPQKKFRMPDFVSRFGEGLTEQDDLLVTGMLPESYCAELNVNPQDAGCRICFGLADGHMGSLILKNDHTYSVIEDGRPVEAGSLARCIGFSNYLAVRITREESGRMTFSVNDLKVAAVCTTLPSGRIGLEKGCGTVGFAGWTDCTQGEYDRFCEKAVPGRFDCVHARETVKRVCISDASLPVYAAAAAADMRMTFPVNVKESGLYEVIARVKGFAQGAEISCRTNEDSLSGKTFYTCTDKDGFAAVSLGRLRFPEGYGIFEMTARADGLIDYIELLPAADVTDMTLVKDGEACRETGLRILGHKRENSMLTKICGFTCAENYGIAYCGRDGWKDYLVNAQVLCNPGTDGHVGIYVRVRKESWFQAQTSGALFGYQVRIDKTGVRLWKHAYSEQEIAFAAVDFGRQKQYAVFTVAAEGRVLTVSMNGRQLIACQDESPYLFGKMGVDAFGEGWGFQKLELSKV